MATATNYRKIHPFNMRMRWSNQGTATDLTQTVVTDGVYTVLGDLKSLNVGGVEFGESDTTHLASSNAFKESMAGWGKQKPIKFNLYFQKDNLEALLESTVCGYGRGTANFVFQGVNPTAPTSGDWAWYHTAWIKDINIPDISADSDDPLMAEIELQPTGRSNFSTVTNTL